MTDTKTINMTVKERLDSLTIINGFKGKLETLAVILEDVKQLPITEAEWAECGLVKTPNPNGTENWKWDEEKVMKDIALHEDTYEFIRGEIKRRSDAGELTLEDVALISLKKKLS